MVLKEGQSWYYVKKKDQNSFLVIQKIDKVNKVVHVSINVLDKSDEAVFIAHMPFAEFVMLDSLEELRKDDEPRRLDEFNEAFQVWHDQQGGVWEISVDDAVQMTLRTIE